MSTELLPAPKDAPGEIRRHEFGADQLTKQAETAVAGIAAREQAAVNARYVMAERHPRNIEGFRTALLHECERPGFAEAAEYKRPVGWGKNKKTGAWEQTIARGPTIRFIEGALRAFRNVYPEVTTSYDDANMRIVRVTVTDLEANLAYASEITITKRVERRGKKNKGTGNVDPPEGREVLGQRTTGEGNINYIVRATDDELLSKGNALISKAIRTLAQRLLPADIVEECMTLAKHTMADRDAADPDAAKRTLIDSFDGVGVAPEDLREYLGHDLERIQPGELQDLRGIFAGLREGDTWDTIMAAKAPSGSREAQEEAGKAALDKLRKAGEKPGGDKATTKKRKRKTKSPETAEVAGAAGDAVAESPPPEVIEVDELPEPIEAADGDVVRYKGEEWECCAETSSWRRVKPKADPQPTESKRLVFGGNK